ncbi:Domain of unknown function DUF4812 [Cinara cedri]|uniref:Cilia- and flagella-associated protein 126 n=1 Tax=Cinara cedri TaxID=506608 RepID=A0A5E4N7A9_9HEMI|nr:Domain of unknown function DUF4812 [Cinara cedri]
MSANYTCNQFDKAFKPTRLGNWEVPKWHLNRPKGRSTITKIIANDNGHLLPGVQKADQKNWAGLYLGTYRLPKRISKEIAIELSNPKCQTWMKRSYHHPFIDRCRQNKIKTEKHKNANADGEPCKTDEEVQDKNSIKSVESTISNRPAVAAADGSVVEMLQNRTSADEADEPLNSSTLVNDKSEGVEGRRGDSSSAKIPSSPALSRISMGGGHNGGGDVNDNRDGSARETAVETPRLPPGRRYDDTQRHHGLPDAIEDALYRSLQTKRHKNPGLGLNGCWPKCSAVAYKSFNDPGPTQCSKLRVYRPKTSSSSVDGDKKEHSRQGGGDKNSRPKTCVPVMTADQLTDIKLALCWDLDAPFDRHKPARPSDEPAVFHKVQQQQQQKSSSETTAVKSDQRKLPQNTSAVMGFVGTAARNDNCGNGTPDSQRVRNHECLPKNRNLSAVMELIPDKDRGRLATVDQRKGEDVRSSDKPSSSSTSRDKRSTTGTSVGSNDRDSKSDDGRDNETTGGDDDKNDDGNPDDSGSCYENTRLRRRRRQRRRRRSPPSPPPRQYTFDSPTHRRRHHRGHDDAVDEERVDGSSRGHRGHRHRPCLACDNLANDDNYCRDNCNNRSHRRSEEHCGVGDRYKMAFKAGVPVSTPVKNRTTAAGQPAKHLRVPKPKTTNSDKKKYVIGTLLPPFSMWPGTTARDYPEHWRLTSVYRQAFKPLELRKQPLLQTVYL